MVVEFGASTYRSQGSTNWELELPFKKPFRLSNTIEVMPGMGHLDSFRPDRWCINHLGRRDGHRYILLANQAPGLVSGAELRHYIRQRQQNFRFPNCRTVLRYSLNLRVSSNRLSADSYY